jgi:hypothetical protein
MKSKDIGMDEMGEGLYMIDELLMSGDMVRDFKFIIWTKSVILILADIVVEIII